ncbi:MAG: hypothetical protein JO202_10290 [Ktedonobacteraceae bacterium]|nr:hypothetical protein [Ktedonobacteraceae bacterium]
MREQRASHYQQQSRPAQQESDEDEEDDRLYETRLPTSTRRYHTTSDQRTVTRRPHYEVEVHRGYTIPRRASQQSPPARQQAPPPETSTHPPPQGMHWVFYLGVAMLVMLLGWFVLSALLSWWQVTQDDWHYGRPRTYQTDARVGHHDNVTPSHFLALNLHGQSEVIEFPGGDATQAKVYLGPVLSGPGADLVPVTVRFKDVTGDGKPDLVLQMGEQSVVFVNDTVDGIMQFRPARAGEASGL